MKRSHLPFLLLSLMNSIVLSGCSDSQNASSILSAQTRPEWTVEIQAQCGDLPAESCTAAYPYAISADGSYKIGPGPQGQILTGKLSNQEFSEVQQIYAAAAPALSNAGSDSNCIAESNPENLGEDVRIISSTGSVRPVVHTDGHSFCSSPGTSDSAHQLLNALRDSASRHYPLPFPDDACDESRAALESLYGTTRMCSKASDCAFFDEKFEPVITEKLTFLADDDCSGAHALIVGNKAEVATKRRTLLELFSHTQQACAARASAHCTGFSDFQPTRPAPLCINGTCRAPQER